MKTCILISSCEKYRGLAHWTADRIARKWASHPPLFFSGLNDSEAEFLPLEGDARDWMDVTLNAVRRLLAQGFDHTYFVLDDLPPMGRCNARYLNQDLPATAQRLGTTYVGLLGYGQHRPPEGPILGGDNLFLEHTPPSYRWKFSLHPGLWNLERLAVILESRMKQYGPGDRTPWNFERHRDGCGGDVPVEFLKSCYRINGCHYETGSGRLPRRAMQTLGLFFCDAILFGARISGGATAREKAALRLLWPYCYYRGPYPVFWSGVMRQGRISGEFESFTRRFPWLEISKEWKKRKKTTV